MAGVRRPAVPILVLVGALLFVFPYLHTWPVFDGFLDEFRTFQATRFAIWLIILYGLNLLTGYSGQITLGHGAPVAIGAYTAAILMTELDAPLFAAVLGAGLLTGALGFVLGVPALRLTGPYLAIATLAAMLAMPQILKLNGISDWTGGSAGLILDTPRAPGALSGLVSDRQWLYYSCMVPAAILTLIGWNIAGGRLGRSFLALRDSELGAEQMGVNVPLYKMTAFGLSAFYAGLGGALFAYTEAFMSPDSFDVGLSITMLIMIVLGGLASLPGTIFAAVIMTFRIEIVDGLAGIGLLELPGDLLPGEEQSPDTLRGALYGLMLILTIMFMPKGVAGFLSGLQTVRPQHVLASARQLPSRWSEGYARLAALMRAGDGTGGGGG